MMRPRHTVSAICAALALSFAAPLVCLAQAGPRVFLFDPAMLVRLKNADAGDAHKQQVFLAAKTAADRAMHEGPFSVVQKGITPPSGDKHDYMSQAPYFWADPSKANGLPYIRRDGQRNPELKKISDHDQFGKMGDNARVLALEYYLTGRQEYADRAELLLRTWFLDPATKMNPNLEFGQGIPGINTGRGIGIIESRSLLGACEAVGLLAGSNTWTVSDEQGIKMWMAAYLSWMRNSQKGKDEDAAKNNHGTWYDLQVTELALFLGDRKLAVDTLERVKTRRITQIDPNGRQPLETARTNGWGYSNGNLDGLTQLATLGERVGVDLWNYKTPDGRSIRGAIDFLLPYAVTGKKWEYQQIGGFKASDLEHTLERAAVAYHDPKYAAAAKQIRDGKDLATAMLASD
ncbi:MAG TPA: alginate lyase family protein [Edaphobacter sp.]|nr:alginate lyase family protein [Edaphobacter sp.]